MVLPHRLETAKIKGSISLVTPRYPKARFKVSFLCYALTQQPQYEITVKLLGSFRLTAGTRHLYRDCIFTEQVLETVSHSLRHSCTSELTRQGNTLNFSFSSTTNVAGTFHNWTLSSPPPQINDPCAAVPSIWSLDGLVWIMRHISVSQGNYG